VSVQTQVEKQKVTIAISVEPHEYVSSAAPTVVICNTLVRYFARDGHDLHLNVPLTLYEAVMGTELTVPTLKGEKQVKVSKGTQPKSQQVLKGMGVQQLDRRGFGDMYLHFEVQIPDGNSLTTAQKDALKLFSPPTASDAKDNRSETGERKEGFFKRFFKSK
jgi:molecular chaperone DnaJ